MTVFADLSEEEAYLYAILQDHSGIDLAEFAHYDPESPGEVWRAWPFQWKWYKTRDTFQISQCGRSVGKTQSVILKACAFAFQHSNQEMLITAPRLIHLEPLTKKIEQRINTVRLYREMLVTKNRGAITHRPFTAQFNNSAVIEGRIPNLDGSGVKGAHPLILIIDEGQDFPEDGYKEVNETVKRGFNNSQWLIHGVTKGIRDDFFEFTQPTSNFTVHRYTAMHRPNWTDDERREKIKQYGSRDAPDYRRNILGLHGDAMQPIFVEHRLFYCIDLNEDSEYNKNEYAQIKITAEGLVEEGLNIEHAIDLPILHQKWAKQYTTWVGVDLGMTQHPSEMLVFCEFPRKDKESQFKLIARIHLERIRAIDQVNAMKYLVDFYQPRALAMDKTGLGLPIYQMIQDMYPEVLDKIKGYNFSEKVLVDFDKTVEVNEYHGDPIKEAGIVKNVLEHSTDQLRILVDSKRLQLPYDTEVIRQFQGSTWQSIKTGMDQYGRTRKYSTGTFHALDAARMAALAHGQHAIEEFVKPKEPDDVLDVFFLN